MYEYLPLFYGLESLIHSVHSISIDEVNTKRSIDQAYEGVVYVSNQQLIMQIGFPYEFPCKAPLFFVKERTQIGFIPHVEVDGYICYLEEENLLLDQTNPKGVLEECLKSAISTLEKGMLGQNHEDFLNEFEAYWIRQETIQKVVSLITLNKQPKIIRCWLLQTGDILVADTKEEASRYIRQLFHEKLWKEAREIRGFYVPLRDKSRIMPPDYGQIWDIKTWRRTIFSNISSSSQKRLRSLLQKRYVEIGNMEVVLTSIPQPNGNMAVVGILLHNFRPRKDFPRRKSFHHPMLNVKCNFDLTPLYVERHNTEFLVNRSGGNNEFISKHVAIVGLGSVGSRIAKELANAGVTQLTFVDPDRLLVENIHRHELGTRDLYEKIDSKHGLRNSRSKVAAMKNHLLQQFPLMNIKTYSKGIQRVLEADSEFFQQFDLIILVTGDHTIELFINQLLHSINNTPPTIFTWVEPLGIGGHALLTLNNRKNGCLECLYTSSIDDEKNFFGNRASFSALKQVFTKSVSGCGSVFTPYGSLDSMQTAILATRLAISTLARDELDNPLLSWKGNANLFLANDKRLSPRYELSVEDLYQSRYAYKQVLCPVCAN